MTPRILISVFALLVIASPAARAADAPVGAVARVGWSADGKIDFVQHVQPILQASCVECHSADNKKGRLRLDAKQFAIAGGQSGAILTPGKSGDSLLIKRVRGEGGEKQMPFKRPALPEKQIRILAAWVDQGATWPEGVDGPIKEEKVHWSFVKPVRPEVPAVQTSGWVRNPIDAFVLARLEKEGLKPSPEATKVELIRRASLDLVGLPPTLAEIDTFVADTSPDAYEKLVDRLLASPHYGERWARQWLDAARFADTNGYEKDRPRNIWPYRDWVINALNKDLPFNQFTIEQIAGDLLPNATTDQIVATGFHRNTLINEEGGIDVEEFRFKALVDRIETTSKTWLGLTLQCAQCHTHKYDPVTQKEYYRLFAMLNNADEPELKLPDPAIAAKRAEIEKLAAANEANLAGEFPAEAPTVRWTTISPNKLKASSGAALTASDDGIVLASGPAAQSETYTLNVKGDLAGVTALRLEAITDPSLPKTGPGRARNGNFVLSDFKVSATVKGRKKAMPIAISSVTADAQQSRYEAALAIDGKPDTGWGIDDGSGAFNQSRSAVFQLAEPLGPKVTALTIVIVQNTPLHSLGKFRLSSGRPEGPTETGASIASKREQRLAEQLTAWDKQATANAGRWTTARPEKMTSRGHATLTTQPDGSVLVTGDCPNNDVYTLDFSTDLKGITGVKLEVLPDESLPENGPGRAPLHATGDFLLSEFEVSAAQAGGGALQPIKPLKASHSFAAANRSAEATLDGRMDTGWSIAPRLGQRHQAVYALPAAVSGTKLRIVLTQQYIHQTTIGRFRIYFTTDPKPAPATEIFPEVESILATVPADARNADQAKAVKAEFLRLTPELSAQRQKIAALRASMPEFQQTMVMRERTPENARVTHLYHRGEFLQPRDPVTAGVPGILHALPANAPANRLGLAMWLVDENNPLVGRVVMNRAWATFFGRGIVNTIEDFGMMGEPPSHPELLDWLATEFPRQGWSMKAMHRLIVTSATYRQSGTVTPELLKVDLNNVLLARGPRNRVEAEMVRDLALSVGGLLDQRIGGPSVFPPQPQGVTEQAYGSATWTTSKGPDRWRRGLYTYLKRMSPYPAMLTFDAPTGDTSCVRRVKSNTPLQALTLLNDQVFVEAAQAFARRVLKDAPATDTPSRLKFAFRLCTGREANADELAELARFLKTQQARFQESAADATAIAGGEALPVPKDSNVPELAAWTVLARAMLNLDETITK